MKLKVALLAILVAFSLNAQDNTLLTTNDCTLSLDSGKQSGSIELTLGGSGTEIKGDSLFGMDFSISTNPLKARPEIWVGLAQGLYWEPSFAGSSDLFVDWSWNLWNDTLYVNTGWSGGILYGDGDEVWRTGPEVTFQYYTSDNAFIYAGLNWDWVTEGDDGLRYSFGIGIAF